MWPVLTNQIAQFRSYCEMMWVDIMIELAQVLKIVHVQNSLNAS